MEGHYGNRTVGGSSPPSGASKIVRFGAIFKKALVTTIVMAPKDSVDIHDYKHTLQLYLNKIQGDKELSEANRKALLRYKDSFIGKAPPTILKNIQVVYALTKKLDKDLKKVTRDNIEKIVKEINDNGNFTQWTKAKYLICLKRFFSWLYDYPKGQYPDQVRWIRLSKTRSNHLPENVLTVEDARAAIQAAPSNRDKALISLFFDTGARIGEIGSMNIQHIEDRGDYMLVILPQSKTEPRAIPIRNSRPYLLEYLATYPNPAPDKPLFVDRNGDRMDYPAMKKRFAVALKRAGINKPANPHHWRRSAATNYGKYFTESELDRWFGWGKQKTSSIYTQFSGKDLLRAYDKFFDAKENAPLKPKHCNKCKKDQMGFLEYCNDCHSKLIAKTIIATASPLVDLEDEIRNLNSKIGEMKKYETRAIELSAMLQEMKKGDLLAIAAAAGK